MKRFQSFRFRYIASSMMVLTVALLVLGALFFELSASMTENMVAQKLVSLTRLGSSFVSQSAQEKLIISLLQKKPNVTQTSEFREIQNALQKLRSSVSANIYLVIPSPHDRSSLIYAVTSDLGNVGAAVAMNPEAQQAIHSKLPVASQVFQQGDDEWIRIFAPILNAKGEVVSLLGLDSPVTAEIHANDQKVLTVLTLCLLVAGAAAGLFGHLTSRSLLNPLQELTAVANAIVNGDFTIRAPVRGNNELSGFAQEFNKMMDQVRETRDALLKQADELFGHANELEETIRKRTVELKEAQETVQAMVDSVNEGFLLFDASGVCRDVSSSNCITLLECKPNLKPIREVLRIPDSEKNTFDRWIRAMFSGALSFEDVSPLGPKRYNHSQGRHIALKYFPLYDDNRKLKSVVIVASDRTEEIFNQAQAREKEKRANFILKAAQMGESLDSFFSHAERDMMKLRLELADLKSSSVKISELVSVIHTIKGEASIFSLEDVSKAAHDLEDQLRDFEKSRSSTLELEIGNQLNRLQEVMLEHRMMFYDINLRSGGPDLAAIRDQRAKLVELIAIMRDLEIPKELRVDLFKYGISQQIGWFFSIYNQLVQDIAVRAGKRVAPIEFENPDLPIYAEPYSELFRSVVHLIRNSLDHGIETPEERIAAGKPEAGQLRFSFERYMARADGWNVRITFSDDGRGIDSKSLREKLRAAKGDYYVDSLSDEQVLQQIFDPGFSTKQKVSELSGRGVGLSAVKQECLNIGGDVIVRSTPGQGTVFTIEVPDSYDQLINSSTKKAS